MRRDLSALLVAVLLVGGLSATAVAVDNAGGDSPRSDSHSKAKDDHLGPPAWAHDKHGQHGMHGKQDGRNADKQAWKKYWRSLTPAQRAAKMAELAQAHADGMKKFAACVQAAGNDRTKRGACERPMPPGLAKKRLH